MNRVKKISTENPGADSAPSFRDVGMGIEAIQLRDAERVMHVLDKIGVHSVYYERYELDCNEQTPLEIYSYLSGELKRMNQLSDRGTEKRKLASAMEEIIALPSARLHLDQLLDFSESMESKFPNSCYHPSQQGDKIADFLEAELAPNLSTDSKKELGDVLKLVRSCDAGVTTSCSIFGERIDVLDSRMTCQCIKGLSILTIDFERLTGCYTPYRDILLRIDLTADWRLQENNSKGRAIVAVKSYSMPSETRQAIDEIFSDLRSKYRETGIERVLHPGLFAFKPDAIAGRLRKESSSFMPDSSQEGSLFMRDRLEAAQSLRVSDALCEAAERIAAMS